jgi:phosphopantothenoylcysteine decarboxylase/phosphopantothenate--cysteine ligase
MMDKVLKDQRILLIIGGGIAAYKSLDLVRRLKERGAVVRAILTSAGAEFVTPLAVGALTGERVFTNLFDLADEQDVGHIRLARDTDLLLVAPATADFLAKMAHGLANDLGAMAERGESGLGRMAEPLEIVAAAETILAGGEGPLKGRRVLVTSGPTHEPIDPVRMIANRSSGRQGHAIAAAAARAGADVTLVSGPVSIPDPAGVKVVHVETAQEMMDAVERALPADIAIFAAAVADWRVAKASSAKMKKGKSGPPVLDLVENPDILAQVAGRKRDRPRIVVGFAAETQDVVENARAKLARKGCDLIIANDVSPSTGIMGGSRNAIKLVTVAGEETWPCLPKEDVAHRLIARLVSML